MAKIKFEETFASPQEKEFAEAIEILLSKVQMEDIRNFAHTVRTLLPVYNLDMVVGSGGSHIYIHRRHQFIASNNPHANNIRWAMITD